MRVFCGSIFTETNTFSPLPTSLDCFRAGILYQGPAASAPALTVLGSPWLEWRDLSAANGYDYRQGIIAFAEPAGLLTQNAHQALRTRLLADLEAAMPLDMVLLALHGSMMSVSCDDVEGELLQAVRQRVGSSAVVGVLIDPHAHLTQQMIDHADILAAFHEWPHDDVEQRARHVFQLASQAAKGDLAPVAARFDCRMIAAYPTRNQPMRSFVDSLKALEHNGSVLSASLVHGFPWGDHPEVGAQMLVWSDGDAEGAARQATQLGEQFYALRDAVTLRADFDIDAAFNHVLAAPRGPVVLCDAGDNVPGGGAGDSTFMLRRALELGLGKLCFGPLWDPPATAASFAAGVGARVALQIGGKSGPTSGDPVEVSARVMRLASGADTSRPGNLGDRAWVRLETAPGDEPDAPIDVVLHSRRATLTDPAVMTDLGIDISRYKAFIGKMLMHGGGGFCTAGRRGMFGGLARHAEHGLCEPAANPQQPALVAQMARSADARWGR